MNKLMTALFMIVMSFIVVAFFTISNESKAGIFSDIADAFTGHVEDIRDRVLVDDEVVGGKILKTATFVGDDSIHWTKGEVSIVELDGNKFIQTHSNFDNGLAPDLYIYINDREVEISKLKKGNGSQVYVLPRGIEVDQIEIWCKRFDELMGTATFK